MRLLKYGDLALNKDIAKKKGKNNKSEDFYD
jgi:hypothetical protein